MTRLNGWQRIGLILSMLWLIGYGINLYREDVIWAERSAKRMYELCMASAIQRADFDKCWDNQLTDKNNNFYKYLNGPDGIAFVFCMFFGPIGLGWFLAYRIIRLFEWVRAGFRK